MVTPCGPRNRSSCNDAVRQGACCRAAAQTSSAAPSVPSSPSSPRIVGATALSVRPPFASA